MKPSDGVDNTCNPLNHYWLCFICTSYDERTTYLCSFLSYLFISFPNGDPIEFDSNNPIYVDMFFVHLRELHSEVPRWYSPFGEIK